MKHHLLFKEAYGGWVSFLTYHPDFYATLGNKFFSVKNGQLWQHNDILNPIRNSFYGQLHEANLSFFVNPPENEEAIFKTVMLEGNDAWDLEIKTNYTSGEIRKDEFNKRESNFYTYFRKNEIETDLSGLKTDGIGILMNFENETFKFSYIPEEICVGDKLFSNDGTNNEFIGIISEIGPDYIKVESVLAGIAIGHFFYSCKDSRIEGSDIRGYYAEITLRNDNQSSVELFAVNTNIVKSYV